MATIVTRQTSGGGATVNNAPLTNEQVDNNFINLNTGKLEVSNNLNDLGNAATARTNLDVYSQSEVLAMAIALGQEQLNGF